MIKGIYTLPSIKHVILIMSSLEGYEMHLGGSQSYKKRMEYFEHIVRSTGRICPREIPLWTLRLALQSDFLNVLAECMPKGLVSSNLSSDNPELMELLAINLVKTPVDTDGSYDTLKYLGLMNQEDIIEVFI